VTVSAVRLYLASASPARLATLRSAGVEPVVEVSDVDESTVPTDDPVALCTTLARLKCETIVERLRAAGRPEGPALVLGCDSVFELDETSYGKPETADAARERLRQMSGRTGVLHTGHHLVDLATGAAESAAAATEVTFAELDDAEIVAYVGTGEPLRVAGSFTIDGLGGPFVSRVDGDPHNVVGLSLPLLRQMVRRLGVAWTDLWTPRISDS
jgi:septum formation protein